MNMLEMEPRWPPWATTTFVGLLLLLCAVHVVDKAIGCVLGRSVGVRNAPGARAATDNAGGEDCREAELQRFRWQYLAVYGLVMFADWLQGTHMYSLYQSYGLDVGALFLTGFLSSAVFGGVVGPIVDAYGRRNACLVYCALEIVINVLENIDSMTVLLFGRVLGGVSTALLFCAFESWMVAEHKARGFDQRSLSKTFAIASEANGILAVIAGLVAQVAADIMGEIGPFRVAVVITALASVFVLQWPENYGTKASESTSSSEVCAEGEAAKREVASDARLKCYSLGFAYSLFEGAMYIFVFLWYPTLESVAPESGVPSGLVFSSFMLSIAIGGKLFDLLQGFPVSTEAIAVATGSVATFSLAATTGQLEFSRVLAGFVLFEVCVGAFTPCCAALRGRYFASEGLSTTLGNFRLPTNVLVVLGTGAERYATSEQLFYGCSAILGVSTACAAVLLSKARQPAASKSKAQ